MCAVVSLSLKLLTFLVATKSVAGTHQHVSCIWLKNRRQGPALSWTSKLRIFQGIQYCVLSAPQVKLQTKLPEIRTV